MEISRYLKRQSDVHTIAFVKEKAYSGAAMVAVACDEILDGSRLAAGRCGRRSSSSPPAADDDG